MAARCWGGPEADNTQQGAQLGLSLCGPSLLLRFTLWRVAVSWQLNC